MALSNIYIYSYNNYFNRIIKKEANLASYGTPTHTLTNTNFEYNDGVNTSHIFNYNGDGDYLIVTDLENNILHRWFIIENKKIRENQYQFQLRRDLMIDFYDIVVTAPMIISRAMVNDINNPLLYNDEGFSFNQIKKQETLLKQYKNNNAYYYVLYFAKDAVAAGVESTESFPTISGSINLSDNIPYNISVGVPIQQSIYKTATYKNISNQSVDMRFMYDYDSRYNDRNKGLIVSLNESNIPTFNYPVYVSGSTSDYFQMNTDMPDARTPLTTGFTNQFGAFKSALETQTGDIPNPITQANIDLLTAASNGNLTIKDSDNKYWKVHVTVTPRNISQNSNSGLVFDWAEGVLDNLHDQQLIRIQGWSRGQGAIYNYDMTTVDVWVEDVTPQTARYVSYEIDFGHFYNSSSPYNIVVIPANDQDMRVNALKDQTYLPVAVSNKKIYNDRILENIMVKSGKWLLDVQVLPYFPVKSYISSLSSRTYIDSNYYGCNDGHQPTLPEFYQNSALDVGYTNVNFGWWAYYVQNPSFEFNITNGHMDYDTVNLKINGKDNPTAMDYKIENECSMYRISSPNFNGGFDFNLAKNQGLEYINVDVTLRPYNPYYHINPKFNYLYGEDFNDCRGLICQGDFSLPIITDQFKNYEIENKNYQQMFNRQIEHLEFQQRQERTATAFSAVAGTFTGAAAGMLAGSRLPGGGGAIPMAAMGAGLSAIGGGLDYSMMLERQREDKDYAIDNYRYQLGNIKALPTTVNKVTPLTNNNKIYPVLEYYTCTDTEKDLLQSYLEFKSMAIDKIGYISQYQQSDKTFIQGTLIRLEGSGLANNEVYEIYDELKKGVYI